MTKRKYLWACAAALIGSALWSEGARKDEITLLMVPREEETVRLGVDIAQRYPSLLVSYKLGAGNAVSLHGWTGTEWVNIAPDNFKTGDFFNKGPDSALIVEKSGVPVPASLIPPAEWCSTVSKIRTTEMRPLLHLTGRYYDFPYKEWKWFARRYGMNMDAINPEGLNVAWYHRQMSEHFKSRPQHGNTDLQYWVSVRQPVVVTEPEAAAVAAEEQAPADEGEPEMILTNEVPEAVVLGPADADESKDGAKVEAAAAGEADAAAANAPAEKSPAEPLQDEEAADGSKAAEGETL